MLLSCLDHTSSFEIINTRIDIVSLCDIIFMYGHRYYNAYCALKFSSSFKLFRSCPLLKVAHAYQNFLQQNSKALSYRSMEQLGVSCVKQGEGFYYFDFNIFYFGRIKLLGYAMWAFCSCYVSNGTYIGCFITKKYLVTPDVFGGHT